MNFIDLVETIQIDENYRKPEYFEKITDSLEERLSWLEDREPESDGMVHDDWEEKYDELEQLRDAAEEISSMYEDEEDWEEIEEDFDQFCGDVWSYQSMYGGLKRWKV